MAERTVADDELLDQVDGFMRSIQRYSFSYLDMIGQVVVTAWTPAFTFTTPGNLNIAYSTQTGRILRIGPLAVAFFAIVTSTFTHTTASGTANMTGLPFTSRDITGLTGIGSCFWGGITKANYTEVTPRILLNTSVIEFVASGSAQTPAALAFGDFPSGGTVRLTGTLAYLAK